MPPKKKEQPKAAPKVVVDKTFGLKNKNKSKKVQQFVQQVQQQQAATGISAKTKKEQEDKKKAQEDKKKAEDARKNELAELFKPVQAPQKVPFGTDPKTVLCIYFKQGKCERGDKCKFSHDLNIERKSAKRDMYTDARSGEEKKEEGMEDWDDAKLKDVVGKKHGSQKIANQTDIICKYFLEAIENRKYGWFWECPNGGDKCIYRHALPPGYVLKSQKKEEDEEEKITLEQFIETARHELPPFSELKPVTAESFAEWNRAKKKAAEEADMKKREQAKEKGSGVTGREFFQSGAYHEDEAEEEGEDLDLSEFRKRLEETVEEGESFQLGGGNPQINVQETSGEGYGQNNDRI